MIQKFEYKRATMEDIDELVRTRIIVLRAANKLSDDEDMSVVEEESKAYYGRALETLLERAVSAFIRLCRPTII